MLNEERFKSEVRISVPFHDVDAAQVVWHGHYLKYFEIARCQLLNKFDYSYKAMQESGYFWPIVDLRIKYIRPLEFGQVVLVQARIIEWEYRLKIEYVVRDADTLEKLTKGYTIQVAFDIDKKEMQYESPAVLKHLLGVE